MRHVFQNMTNEPVTFCVWAMAQEKFTKEDFVFLKGLDIPIKVDAPSHTFDTMSRGTHTVVGKPLVTLVTSTEQQRSMLFLKYGNKLALLEQSYVMPNTTMYD